MISPFQIGNLTCVLADLGALDANLNVDRDFYANRMWTQVEQQNQFDNSFTDTTLLPTHDHDVRCTELLRCV